MIHAFAMLLALTTTGTWTMQSDNGHAYMDLRWSDGEHHNNNGHTINPADFGIANIESTNGHVTFTLHREAGDYAFEGWMNAGNGGGTYRLTLNDGFFNGLSRRGYDVNDLEKKVTFASVDMTMSYINSIEAAGLHVSTNQLVTFKALNIDSNYFRDLDSVGFSHLAAHDYVTFRALKIDSSYIKYLEAHGFKNLTVNQVVTMKAERI